MSDANTGVTSWMREARLGLFIHWGLYSVPARHEWVKSRERLSDLVYDEYFAHFDPDLYDPASWAREAKNAGMRYFVITTKHHEGFCLWDSQLTDYKATNTPAKRDLLRPMVDAFRAEGLKVGFYHSLIDWHHPDFPVDGFHPQRDDEEFKRPIRAGIWPSTGNICTARSENFSPAMARSIISFMIFRTLSTGTQKSGAARDATNGARKSCWP